MCVCKYIYIYIHVYNRFLLYIVYVSLFIVYFYNSFRPRSHARRCYCTELVFVTRPHSEKQPFSIGGSDVSLPVHPCVAHRALVLLRGPGGLVHANPLHPPRCLLTLSLAPHHWHHPQHKPPASPHLPTAYPLQEAFQVVPHPAFRAPPHDRHVHDPDPGVHESLHDELHVLLLQGYPHFHDHHHRDSSLGLVAPLGLCEPPTGCRRSDNGPFLAII